MKMVGVNNILIMAKTEKGRNGSSSSETKSGKGENKEDEKSKGQYSPGLNLLDAEAIKSMIPTVEHVSPEVIFQTDVITNGIRTEVTLTGVTPAFFKVYNLELIDGGMFNEEQLIDGKPVCIIGPTLKSKFFPTENAIGKDIKCGPIWLKVIGVLKKNDVSQSSIENLGISDYNNSVYAPIQTLLRRYKDRSLVTASMIRGNNNYEEQQEFRGPEVGAESENNNSQVDKIVVQVRESSQIVATTDILTRMMKRRHAGVEDVEIKVPELLLKQEQRTKDIFNIVLGAIASISLLIGGIGIMNIMLASVMERIKEIGIRQAIGATKRDVVLQFLMEATLLSVSGGVIGILLGLALSKIIMEITGILTIVSILSIVISFGVSASVGIIFGYMPSRQAAMHDPVESLRHD
jgi:putative ABC transport system permease protein